jgi:photosystem II stability/assembly factor-like uncharacterized protein
MMITRKFFIVFFICLFTITAAVSQVVSPVITGSQRLALFSDHRAMTDGSEYRDLEWQFLGPVNFSGRCTDVVAASPRGENYIIYVASASGGVWKTVNEGTTWLPVFSHEASASIGDIALDPRNNEVLWVGTGEANIFRSSQSGSGIYKTTDGGESWSHKGLENTHTIARIVIHPDNSDVVFVAASGHEWTNNPDRGIYKTTDGGDSWNKVLFVDDMTGAIDLVINPQDPDILYAATWQRVRKKWNDPRNDKDYSGSGIWKTTDGGDHWIKVNNGLPEPADRGRIGIDLCRSKPDVVYAYIDNYEMARDSDYDETDSYGRPKGKVIKGAMIFRSDDAAASWYQVSGLTDEMGKFMENHSATYGWVFGQIRVDPLDENTIYTMGLELNVSNDGGRTFRSLEGMHVDHHGLWIDPHNNSYLLNVNDGGICVSYDRGENWKCFLDNLPLAQFFNIACDMDVPFRVYGSVQDHGSYRGKVDLSEGRDKINPVIFDPAPGGEGSTHAIDPTNPEIVYSAGFYGTIMRSVMKEKWWEQTRVILPAVFPDEPKLRGQWIAPFIISPHNPDIIYHGMQYVLQSKDRGQTWEKISPDLTANNKDFMGDISYQTLTALSESPLKYGLIYAGTDDGRIYRTRDGGKTWTGINDGLLANKWVSRLVASAYDMATVYLTQNGKRDDDFAAYIWKSDDFGDTWKDISSNIPLGPVNVIREDPVDRNILYAGTDIGVYMSKDQGASWNVLGNLPTVYVHDLVIHPRDNIIIIATHGRGIWIMDANQVNGGRNDQDKSGYF